MSLLLYLAGAAPALAAGGGSDPTKIGDNVKNIVSPNVKAFWWVALVVGLLAIAVTKKASRAAGVVTMLVISGIAIYNPAGITNFITGVADRVL